MEFDACRFCHTMAAANTARIHIKSGDAISGSVHNGSFFHEYPPSRPFIHDDYRRDVTKPIIAYPESNRHGKIEDLLLVCFEMCPSWLYF